MSAFAVSIGAALVEVPFSDEFPLLAQSGHSNGGPQCPLQSRPELAQKWVSLPIFEKAAQIVHAYGRNVR